MNAEDFSGQEKRYEGNYTVKCSRHWNGNDEEPKGVSKLQMCNLLTPFLFCLNIEPECMRAKDISRSGHL